MFLQMFVLSVQTVYLRGGQIMSEPTKEWKEKSISEKLNSLSLMSR